MTNPGPSTRRLMAPDGMIYIPPGGFLVGTSKEQVKVLTRTWHDWEDDWFSSELELSRGEHLSGYWLDKYPVTNIDYRAFCQETNHAFPAHWIRHGHALADVHPLAIEQVAVGLTRDARIDLA